MSEPRILVCDRGAFVPFAQALAADADVKYFSEFRGVAAESKNAMVGRDVPGLTRVDSLWDYIDDVDVVVFPDVGDGDLQHWLREQGYKVWGSGRAEMLELDRWEFKRLLKKAGMPVVPTEHLIGLDALEVHLRAHEDVYVKTSFFRGDFETFHHLTWELTQAWFHDLKSRLGPHGDEIELLVEESIDASEIGYDGYCIDGVFPALAAWGPEVKDSAYVGKAESAEDLPVCLQEANAVLSDVLRKLGIRGNYHNEVRVTDDGVAYFTDPTTRCGSPPIACMSLWISNWVDIVVAGADGECVDPIFTAPYAAEIELSSPWLEEHWLALEIPKEIESWVRLRRPLVIDGQWWCVPHEWLDIAGSAVGLGATPGAAIDAAVAVAEEVKGFQVTWNHDVKAQLLEAWVSAGEACRQKPQRAIGE